MNFRTASCVGIFVMALAVVLPAGAGGVRHRAGGFTFAAPLALTGPDDPALSAQEVEPRAAFDAAGNIYVASIQGVPAGTDVWKSMDGGRTFSYLGEPDGAQAAAADGVRGAGIGGGDEDIAVGASGRVYVASLWLGAVTQSASSNGGSTWTTNPVASDLPADDRQWIAADGDQTVYLTYKQLGVLLTGTDSIFVAKSVNGGLTFSQITEVTTPSIGVQPGIEGNIVVDPRTHDVYLVFVGADGHNVYLAHSLDGGKTFIVSLVTERPAGTELENVFPAMAIDQGGNLHVTYSDGHGVYLTSSADQGKTWTPPAQVNSGADTVTTVFPWLDAGAAGKVDLVWLGTSAASQGDAGAQWKVFFAQTQDAFAATRTFRQTAATGVVHTGPVCTAGTGCASGTRTLADYFTTTVYEDGSALIVYPSDQTTSQPVTYFIRQTGGPLASGSK